ncbi:protein HEXIM1 [Biomphalaria glabrata]|uniref:Protein HEXIM1-like n=1 Tax=Biomphalaria glabrata TaxID=6526 RepID=A0A2C9L8W9_BIOGL|nr:protein HEXIM1-like [Biomphalaria glabrata]KAI8730330.1 protein HEXIM1-like [Biomphalaria glabrata]KAI8778577.1 protein HEXIM1 [Biomphalaria glabrata]
MAESLMDVDLGILAQVQKIEKSDVDSGDCEDSSSGSDRSYEADDADGIGRTDSGSGSAPLSSTHRTKRKRRHGSHGSRRHKGGSRHKHKSFQYQPYPPADEIKLKRKSQELQEKENAAAVVRRDGVNQQYMTFPVAPFNSTQFLMDEHNISSPSGIINKTPSSSLLNQRSPQSMMLHSVPSTPADVGIDCINLERKDKEFSDIYTTVHAESLQSLPKEELVKHYINLEEKVALLQKKVAQAEQLKQDDVTISAMYIEKDCAYDSVSCSDTNSLSSSNEEFVDLNVENQTSLKECTVSADNAS